MPEVQLHHDGHPMYRRMVRFDWSQTPLHWVPDDPFATHMINVLHLLLPEGERHFIKAVLEASSLVDDPELESAIKPFVQQESWHAWAHQVVLDHLAEQGIDTRSYTDRLGRTLSITLGDPPKRLPKPLHRWWLYRRLADVAALEHFTAMLGQWVLQNRTHDNIGTDPVMLDLLRWHGAEEVEHRAVAFDMYQHCGGTGTARYTRRIAGMAVTAPVMLYLWVWGTAYLMRHDPQLAGRLRYSLKEHEKAVRKGLLPAWRELGAAVPRYLRRSYHPSREGSLSRAVEYLKRSPAARAAS